MVLPRSEVSALCTLLSDPVVVSASGAARCVAGGDQDLEKRCLLFRVSEECVSRARGCEKGPIASRPLPLLSLPVFVDHFFTEPLAISKDRVQTRHQNAYN